MSAQAVVDLSGAELFEGLATSPDPWVRLMVAADDLRGMIPGVDEALDADGSHEPLRRLLVALAQDPDPCVRATACSSVYLPAEIAQVVTDLGRPGQLRAGWVGIIADMGSDCDDMALRLAAEADPNEQTSSRPELWEIWGAMVNAKTPIPRLVSLLVPALASAAAEHDGIGGVHDVVVELAADPDPRIHRAARALLRRWPR